MPFGAAGPFFSTAMAWSIDEFFFMSNVPAWIVPGSLNRVYQAQTWWLVMTSASSRPLPMSAVEVPSAISTVTAAPWAPGGSIWSCTQVQPTKPAAAATSSITSRMISATRRRRRPRPRPLPSNSSSSKYSSSSSYSSP